MIVCVGEGGNLVCTGFGTNWDFWHLLGDLRMYSLQVSEVWETEVIIRTFLPTQVEQRLWKIEWRTAMRLRRRETLRTACQWHGGLQKRERQLLSLTHCQSPLAPTGSLTLGSRLIYAKVAYKVVACMSVLIGNYYTKTNPRAILPNSAQKSLGKPGYMCRAINCTMEQTLQREDIAQMSGAPGSWLQLAHRSHQPLPTEEACFALGSASGWRGQQGTPVQSLGNAPPSHPHRKAAAHFFFDGKQETTCCVSLPSAVIST